MKIKVDRKKQVRLFSEEEIAELNNHSTERPTDVGEHPVWTDKKARFIMLYLKYFVFITKHGTYIDGFAGPQEECETDAWAAKLVLESKPRWLRHFHLCDASKAQVKRLETLKAGQPAKDEAGKPLKRQISIHHGDFNEKVDEILSLAAITDKEATFCLLDQRTFECDWATVGKIARFKQSGNKIELFYFLANGWFERALSGQKDTDRLAQWWGREDWASLRKMSRESRRDAIVDRLKKELGYKNVKPYQIFEREDGGKVMYYMIHATDHPDGPLQMSRAYRNTVRPEDPYADAQDEFGFADEIKEPESQLPRRSSRTA